MTKHEDRQGAIALTFARKVIARTADLRASVASTYKIHEAELITLDELDSHLTELRYDFAWEIQSLVDEVTPTKAGS